MGTNITSDYWERARSLLSQARESVEQENWALSITRSAETTEYSLKATIRLTGGTYRRSHDVSGDLVSKENYQHFPS